MLTYVYIFKDILSISFVSFHFSLSRALENTNEQKIVIFYQFSSFLHSKHNDSSMVTYNLIDIPDIIPLNPNESLQWGLYSLMDPLSKARYIKKMKHNLRVLVYNRRQRRRHIREMQTGRESRIMMICRRIRRRSCKCPDRLTYPKWWVHQIN